MNLGTIIAEKCINSETKRPFSVGLIESSLKDMHVSIHPTKSAKSQALELIRELEKKLPLLRAQMRIRIYIPTKLGKTVKQKLASYIQLEDEQHNAMLELIGLMEPGDYRKVDEIVGMECKGAGRLEVMEVCVKEEKEEFD